MLFWSVWICSLKPQKTLCFVLFQIFRRQFHLPSGRKTIYPDIKAEAKCEHFQIQTLLKLKFKMQTISFGILNNCASLFWEKLLFEFVTRIPVAGWCYFRGSAKQRGKRPDKRFVDSKSIVTAPNVCSRDLEKTSFRIIMMSMYIYYNSWFKSRSTMSNI